VDHKNFQLTFQTPFVASHLLTYKIIKAKAFNEDVDESWIKWAVEMMQVGFESEHLCILAGVTKPYNQFELQPLANQVFKDLQLEHSDKETVFQNYIYYLISTSVVDPKTYVATLPELTDFCIEGNMDSELFYFYLLYFANDELNDMGVQFYWEGADMQNIDTIIKQQFQKWLRQYDSQHRLTSE
jgi:sulfur relay (sulfurtransferase) DsrC/TusE family protein